MARAPKVDWTREHELIALNLYFKLPFGKLHKTNPLIVDAAKKMGRSASSLSMKLTNLASLDPVQKARGIKGLPGASKQDRAMWVDFQDNLATLGPESEQLFTTCSRATKTRKWTFLHRDKVRLEPTRPLAAPTGPTESTAIVTVRRGQQFFRQSILNAYNVRCCISGINVPRLLVASHIKPWRPFPNERLNPCNGLCLSSLHDAAFDAGLITLDGDHRVVLSKRLKNYFPQTALEDNFVPYAGERIRMPDKLSEPSAEFLKYHRETIFSR
jgi:putative restriction endonuclease